MKNLFLILSMISGTIFGQGPLGGNNTTTETNTGNNNQSSTTTSQQTNGLQTNFTPDYSVIEETPAMVVTLQGLESRIIVLSEIFNHRIGKLNKNAMVNVITTPQGFGESKDFTHIFINGKYITSIQISNVLYAKIEAERRNTLSDVQVGEFIPRLCVAQSAQIDEVIGMLPEKVIPNPNPNNDVTSGSSTTTTVINNYYIVKEPVVDNVTPDENIIYYQQPATELTWREKHGDAVGTGIVAGTVGLVTGLFLGNNGNSNNNVYTTYGGSIPNVVGGSNTIGSINTGGTLIGGSNTGN